MCVHAKSLQLCLTLCSPLDCSLPGFSLCGDSPGNNIGVGCHDFLQGIFPKPGIQPTSLLSLALSGRLFTTSTIWEAHI